jgi:hypothetical protein
MLGTNPLEDEYRGDVQRQDERRHSRHKIRYQELRIPSRFVLTLEKVHQLFYGPGPLTRRVMALT